MSTATLENVVQSNSVPAVALPAPGPTDDELRQEAAEVEAAEEGEPEVEEQEEDNAVSKRLFGAVQEVMDEIEECKKEIEAANDAADKLKESTKAELKESLERVEAEYKAKLEKIEDDRVALVEEKEARSEELKAQTNEWFSKVQSTFDFSAPKPQKRSKAKVERKTRVGKSARTLILEMMEKQGKAFTKDIRAMLERHGKHSGGVELSRMVNDGSIINKERGLYVLGKK